MSDSVKGVPSQTDQPSSAGGPDAGAIPPDIDLAPTVIPRTPGSGSPHDPTAARQRFIASLVGQRLGRYQIEAHIGTGGMGTVFLARDLQLDRDVALKVLPPEFAHDPTIVQRFRNEARAAAQLDHENIARVYDIGEDQGISYIAFEYVRGETIRDLVQKRGRLSVAETVAYALQVASALAHADARGVVHRDIKPSNIIVTTGGRIKLVDMGLARFFEHQRLGGLTQTGVTLGTFDYIAPEQARDPRSADIRSDIYSLGCTMFHMLTGRPPFPEGNVVQKLLQHQSEPPPDVRQLNPGVPRRLAAILRKMMAKAPEDRYQTAADLITDLIEVATELRIRPVLLEGIPWAEVPGHDGLRWSSVLLWTGALLVLVLLVGFMFRSHLEVLLPRPAARHETVMQPTLPVEPDQPPQLALSPQPRVSSVASDEESIAPDIRKAATEADNQAATVSATVLPQRVTTEQELRDVLQAAAAGAVIELAPPDGVIELTANGQGDQEGIAGLRLDNKRLTIRGAPGTYPVLRLRYRTDAPDVAEWILCELKHSDVTFEGVRFELVGEQVDRPMIFFVCDNSALQLQNCVVVDLTRPVALENDTDTEKAVGTWVVLAGGALRIPDQPLDQGDLSEVLYPSTVTVKRTFFAGGHGFLWADGPVRFQAEEAAWLPYDRLFLLSAPGYASDEHPVIRVEARRCTMTADAGDLFTVTLAGTSQGRLETGADGAHAAVVVALTECVVAAYRAGEATLLRTVPPASYAWTGARNLYYGLGAYARLVRSDGDEQRAETLWEWSRQSQVTEDDSVQQSDWPWELAEAEADADGGEGLLRAALRLARSSRGYELALDGGPVGTRYVASIGPLYGESPAHSLARVIAATIEAQPSRERRAAERLPSATSRREAQPTPSDGTGPRETAEGEPQARVFRVTADGDGDYKTLAEAVDRCPDGSSIELAVDGPVRIKPIVVSNKRVVIRAAEGRRPVLVLDHDPAHESANAFAVFTVRHGTLELHGLMVDTAPVGAVSVTPWSVAQLEGGTLIVRRSILRNRFAQGALVELVQPSARGTMAEISGESARGGLPLAEGTVTLEDSILLAQDVVVQTPALADALLELDNCAVAATTFLAILPSAEAAGQRALVQLKLRQCTVRTRGHLINASGKPDRPWLVPIHADVRRSLLVSAAQEPWIVLRGNQVLDEAGQTGIFRWTGADNVYSLRGPWLSLSETQEGHGAVTIAADEFDAEPYRTDADASLADVSFARPLETDLPEIDVAADLFKLTSETTAGDVGVLQDRIPQPAAPSHE